MESDLKDLRSQFGYPKYPSAHLSHLAPATFAWQLHIPVSLSQPVPVDPCGSQIGQARKV